MVKLIPISQQEFDNYKKYFIPIKNEKVKEVLPQGLATPDHFFFSITIRL